MPSPGDPVLSSEFLLRRSFQDQLKKYMYPDGKATSRVFKLRPKDKGKLSVDVKSMTTFEKAVSDPEKFILFEILNQEVLALSLNTIHDPTPNEETRDIVNPAHAAILGLQEDDDIYPSLLAKKSMRVHA